MRGLVWRFLAAFYFIVSTLMGGQPADGFPLLLKDGVRMPTAAKVSVSLQVVPSESVGVINFAIHEEGCLPGDYVGFDGKRYISRFCSAKFAVWKNLRFSDRIGIAGWRGNIFGTRFIPNGHPAPSAQLISWSLTGVSKNEIGPKFIDVIKIDHFALLKTDVGTQLASRSVLSFFYEANRSEPKHPRRDSEKPFTGLDTEEDELGSVLASVLCLLFASSLYWRGWSFVGGAVAAYAIFGFLLRMDIWSFAVGIF